MAIKEKTSWKLIPPLVMVAFWGSTPVANKLGLTGMPPQVFALLRAVLASFLFIPILIVTGKFKHLFRIDRVALSWLMLLGALQTTLFFFAVADGVLYIPAGIVAVIINTQPLFTAIFAAVILRENISLLKKTGLLLAFISLPLVTKVGSMNWGEVRGYGILLTAALGWSVSIIIFKKKLAHRVEPVSAAALQLWMGTILLAVVSALSVGRQWPVISSVAAWSIGYTALFGTCVPYLLWFLLLKELDASYVSSYSFLIPVFGLLFGYLVFGETLTYAQIMGVIGVIGGVGAIVAAPAIMRSRWKSK